ncbi:MAG TPA: hypothetical protein VMR59_01290 [Patescibacteria group bacterium]|nr:hypothetical protein [Patescibacteria group bacterium]
MILNFLQFIFNFQVAGDFWAMITAIATVLLFIFGYIQLLSLSRTSKSDFIHRFKNDFFTEETRKLFDLIDRNMIKFFDKQANSYFQKNDGKGKKYYTSEIDDLILGHFEDLGVFEKKGVVDIEMVYELFDYYIETCKENSEVEKYLVNAEGDVYENLNYIYKKCKSFGAFKELGRNMLLWRMEWRFCRC